jgi:hypothetical protein
MEPSKVQFSDKDLKTPLSKFIFFVYRLLGLIKVTETTSVDVGETKKKDNNKLTTIVQYESSNFTLINFYLIRMGPTREDRLTFNLLAVQVNEKFRYFYFVC